MSLYACLCVWMGEVSIAGKHESKSNYSYDPKDTAIEKFGLFFFVNYYQYI